MKALVPVKIDTFMATNRKTTFALVSQYQLPRHLWLPLLYERRWINAIRSLRPFRSRGRIADRVIDRHNDQALLGGRRIRICRARCQLNGSPVRIN